MRAHLRYGTRTGELRIADEQLCGHFQGPLASSELTTEQLVKAAIEKPYEAPPIHLACTPDDHIAIVLDADLTNAAMIVAPIVESLCSHVGINAEQISIVHAASSHQGNIDDLIDALPDEVADLQVVEHRADDATSVSYLASTASGRRIYLSRPVIDADFFFVISEVCFDSLTGRRGPSSGLFPTMSNAEAMTFARKLALDHRSTPELLHQRQDCEEIAYMSGMYYGVGVSKDAVGEIDHVWIGKFDAVQRAANAYMDESWSIARGEETPDLVIAVCSPTPRPASWESIGAALESAYRVLGPDGGKIVVVSDAADLPGPGMQILARDGATWEAINLIRETESVDALSAIQCGEAINAATVYLLSGLPSDLVEAMGMVPVASLHEVENLSGKVRKIFLLENADRVNVNVPKVSIYKQARPEHHHDNDDDDAMDDDGSEDE